MTEEDVSPVSENRNTSPDRVASGDIVERIGSLRLLAYFDIVERLRSLQLLHVPIVTEYAEEAAAEIERLRNGAVDTRETVCPHVRGTVTQHCSLNFTLTDEERAAVEYFAAFHRSPRHGDANAAATLRSLLERLS
jgi:hypothetical protein